MSARILILDDEPNIVVSLSRALELEGYAVETASTVAEAEQRIQRRQPDLALLDVRLPDGDGIELLERIKKSESAPPVVMMSGHGTIDEAVRAIQLGAADFLEKPIGQDRLLLTIENTLKMARLVEENRVLRDEARRAMGTSDILGRSKAVVSLKSQIDRVASSEGRVLITGENGTGKELIAAAIHAASPRKDRPFVSLNCAAVPAELIESELFGHEKGAFTGAISRKLGKFERAHTGTLFLDEVGDMPMQMQVKLLRVLQTGELERVGGTDTLRVDVRVVAATNKDLSLEMAEGRFREDLYYRLNVVPIVSPPLRDRKEDIPILVSHFVAEMAERNHRRVPSLSDRALSILAAHNYPGNIRELRNLVERIVILAPPDKDVLEGDDVQPLVPSMAMRAPVGYQPGAKLSDLIDASERAIIAEALEAHGGVIAETARALGVERSNFHKKLKAIGLR
ncbi:MAG: sigma-54-dependent Fis family transcriptional regulator [Deltaproteobacteria bacterium]|nr:sigma-54-dependent Fis family transcriptional regulator [Deltaproteobacteria bacterium]